MEDFNNFEEFMNYYKSLHMESKKDMLLNELKLLAASTNKACKSLEVDNEVIVSDDLADLNKDNHTEEDYIEALMVYTCSIKNSFCDLIDGLNKITEEE